jgi:hypothetical protein
MFGFCMLLFFRTIPIPVSRSLPWAVSFALLDFTISAATSLRRNIPHYFIVIMDTELLDRSTSIRQRITQLRDSL